MITKVCHKCDNFKLTLKYKNDPTFRDFVNRDFVGQSTIPHAPKEHPFCSIFITQITKNKFKKNKLIRYTQEFVLFIYFLFFLLWKTDHNGCSFGAWGNVTINRHLPIYCIPFIKVKDLFYGLFV